MLSCWLVLAGSLRANAQAALHKDLKKDFGAVGDGRTNDQLAFQKAAAFFNQRAQTPASAGRAVLQIPRGVYRVGQAGPSMGDLLHLTGCRNLTIVGDDSATTEIRYADSLRYGAFDPATHLPYEAPTAYFTDWQYAANLGVTIVLDKCDNVGVANLWLNGNSAHLLVGGHWGDVGIQLGADGIFVGDSRRVRVRRLAVHHFGRDGMQVLNHLAKRIDDPSREDILLENLRFDYNGRQGLSITGVNGLRAVKCSFSHTGRVVIPALDKPLYSNPGAGVDLEPEGGFVTNVHLENCRLVDNAGQGIVADRYGNGSPTTQHIVLSHCLIWGVTNWSAWVRQTDFRFENCRIYGAFVTGCALASQATCFVGCTFEDRPYRGQPAYGQYLVYSNQEARAMSFTNCRFVGTHNSLLFAQPVAPDTTSRFRLRGCTLVLDQAEPPLVPTAIFGAVLSGTTVVESGPHRASPARQELVLGDSTAALPLTIAGGSLQLLAAGGHYRLVSGLAIGRQPSQRPAIVVVGAGNTLVLSPHPGTAPALYIGPIARLVVKKGGTLKVSPHTKVIIAGLLVVEEGASLVQDVLAEVRTVGQGRLQVSTTAGN